MDDVLSSIGRIKFLLERLLVMNVTWNYDQQKCMQLNGDVEWMRCHVERGYGNLTPCGSTLWVRVKSDMPFITVLHSVMRRRLVENILLDVGRICTL